MSTTETIAALHEKYEALTGYNVALHDGRMRDWYDWIKYNNPPWTAEDLELVVHHVKARHREMNNQGPAPRLKFASLIRDCEWFEEALGEARARWRNRIKPATPREGA